MNEDQKTAQRMRRQAKKDQEARDFTADPSNAPANYLPPAIINSIVSVKQAKTTFDKLISRELIDMIANGETQTIKLKAMDMYHKLSSSSQLLVKHGGKVAAIDAPTSEGSTINVNFSSHLQSDEPEETLKIASRDLVAEKNEKLFADSFSPEGQTSPVRADIEDADFEVIP